MIRSSGGARFGEFSGSFAPKRFHCDATRIAIKACMSYSTNKPKSSTPKARIRYSFLYLWPFSIIFKEANSCNISMHRILWSCMRNWRCAEIPHIPQVSFISGSILADIFEEWDTKLSQNSYFEFLRNYFCEVFLTKYNSYGFLYSNKVCQNIDKIICFVYKFTDYNKI